MAGQEPVSGPKKIKRQKISIHQNYREEKLAFEGFPSWWVLVLVWFICPIEAFLLIPLNLTHYIIVD